LNKQYCDIGNIGRHLGRRTKISGISGIACDLMAAAVFQNKCSDKQIFEEITFHNSIPGNILTELGRRFPGCPAPMSESYIIVSDVNMNIYSQTEHGLLYAVQDIVNLTSQDGFPEGLVYNYPVCPIRGVKMMLPDLSHMEDFKKFIDLLCSYNYNTIILEIGGAMEYRRHPEINQGWVEYCRFMNEYPGKAHEIQTQCFLWDKNAIHSENGGGSFLSQEHVCELIVYCRERMMEVIPEVPSLSHSDYLLTRHPELAERRLDPYPDTYCPSNPKTYELLFDVLDEVIEIFNPRTINIGHDEFYTMAQCPQCKGKSGAELYAGDINRIYKYLAAKGVKTIMWGEKLLNAHFLSLNGKSAGGACGGAERSIYKNDVLVETVLPTYTAIDLIPRDIEILHWYWGVDRKLEDAFFDRDMEVIYGNFSPAGFPEWKKRISRKGFKGIIISNWGKLNEKTLQRNGILFDTVFSSLLLWNRDLGENNFAAMRDWTLAELFKAGCHAKFDTLSAERIEVIHTTDEKRPYRLFCDGFFLEEKAFLLGHHILYFSNDRKISVPVIYGSNISSSDIDWELRESVTSWCRNDFLEFDRRLAEVAFETLPIKEDGKTYYKIEIVNPFPGERIVRTETKKAEGIDCSIELKSTRVLAGHVSES